MTWHKSAFRLCVSVGLMLASAGCGGDGDDGSSGDVPPGFSADRCLVQVHGRSEEGAAPRELRDYAVLRPDGNAPNEGGGRKWTYDTDEAYSDSLDRITQVVDDAACQAVVLHGFSNGGGLTGALLCRGETLDGRLVGAIVDDPVPDDSSPCRPDPSVKIVVFWTGGLEKATPGRSCAELGWTCAGNDRLVGIDEYAARLGVSVTPSVHDEHLVYGDAPQIEQWLVTE